MRKKRCFYFGVRKPGEKTSLGACFRRHTKRYSSSLEGVIDMCEFRKDGVYTFFVEGRVGHVRSRSGRNGIQIGTR